MMDTSHPRAGNADWTVDALEDGVPLARFLRLRCPERSWNEIRRLIETGKVYVAGARTLLPSLRLSAKQQISLRMASPRPRVGKAEVRIVFEDAHLVIIDKPQGVSSVPFERRDSGTAMDLIRDAWRRMGRPATSSPLYVVHRIDKDTSGLIAFAKTKTAERALAAQFRAHSVERTYLCVAHGRVTSQRVESFLVADRGDGLRGSTRYPGQGKRAVTHVLAVRASDRATLCEVRLETGKTHQIRIHLAEQGHPLVGEAVYVRDFLRDGGALLPSSRLLLHAATLGFLHPKTTERIAFESSLPDDFVAITDGLLLVNRERGDRCR